MTKISISKGNTKMGKIPAFSMTPGRTCSKLACETCLGDCYGMKAYRQYPATRNAWDRNALAMVDDPVEALKQISDFIRKTNPRFFRIHVAGDFISRDNLDDWNRIARTYPDTKFLAFTKRYDFLHDFTPADNLQIVVSAWPGCGLPDLPFPIAWMQDGTETRVPADALECPGLCDSCGMCWQLGKLDRDVVFNKH